MTDLEITKLCAQAMGWKVSPYGHGKDIVSCVNEKGHMIHFEPLRDDAQAMALVKKFKLCITPPTIRADERWGVSQFQQIWIASHPDNLNRAICLAVAKMQGAK